MSKFNFNEINNNSSNNNSNNNNQIGFFSLGDDGDSAIVRFYIDSVDDFDLATVHSLNIDGRFRNVNCLRDAKDPIEKCPFCTSNEIPVKQRFYIHLVQYVQDDKGNIVPQAKIWERATTYAIKLKSFLDDYGPLSDYLFKIVRRGAKGNIKTDYEIMPVMNKTAYPENVFAKIDNPFVEYNVIGRAVMDKSASDMVYYLEHGSFPVKDDNGTNVSPTNEPPVTAPNIPYNEEFDKYDRKVNGTGANTGMGNFASNNFNRPTRY